MEYSVYIFWLGGALLIAAWNRSRGNSFIIGLLISFFLSPLVGFIFVALTSKKIKGIEKQMLNSKEYKKCPQCAELVKVEALKCRFCGKEIEVRFGDNNQTIQHQQQFKKYKPLIIGIAIIVFVIPLIIYMSKIDTNKSTTKLSGDNQKQHISQERERELNKFISKKYDDFQKITWYETNRNTDYLERTSVKYQVELYFGQNSNNSKYFRLRTRYTDNRSERNWMFYENIHLLADNGNEIIVETRYPEKKSDNGDYGLTEWSDNLLAESEVLPLASANQIKVRFNGKYTNTFTMTENQLRAFKEVIEKFKSI